MKNSKKFNVKKNSDRIYKNLFWRPSINTIIHRIWCILKSYKLNRIVSQAQGKIEYRKLYNPTRECYVDYEYKPWSFLTTRSKSKKTLLWMKVHPNFNFEYGFQIELGYQWLSLEANLSTRHCKLGLETLHTKTSKTFPDLFNS